MTTYRDAGVDIDAGNEFVDRIKPLVRSTFRPEVLTDLGGFGGLFGLQAGKSLSEVKVILFLRQTDISSRSEHVIQFSHPLFGGGSTESFYIFVLAFLYVSRIMAGILISQAVVSFWLFSFTFLFFLSLAAMKRFVEFL